MAAAFTSLRRLTELFSTPDLPKNVTGFTEKDDLDVAVRIRNGEFMWEKPIVISSPDDEGGDAGKGGAKDVPKTGNDPPPSAQKDNGYSVLQLEDDEEQPAESSTKQKLVLQGIQFEVKEGEHVAIVGKVGAGKTALLNAILGELVPSQGIV